MTRNGWWIAAATIAAISAVAASGCADATIDDEYLASPDAGMTPTDNPDPVERRCRTRVAYGKTWVQPTTQPNAYEFFNGVITWEGRCNNSGATSYAMLSNGVKATFAGDTTCEIEIDYTAACEQPTECETRVFYAPAWVHPVNHPLQHDDASNRVTWDRKCAASGTSSVATLSNGWRPVFSGTNSCGVALRYLSCRPL